MADKKLRPKYQVQRIVGDLQEKVYNLEGPKMLSTDSDDVNSPFVLMPRKDPAAFYALLNYSKVCEPDLALEIREWVEKIIEAPPILGTQGVRNRIEMKRKQLRLFG